jgi:hypothetical protein
MMGVIMGWLDGIQWITKGEALGFMQMGFFLGLGYTVLRFILGSVSLIFTLLMKAWFG